jgi:hypothetical protein
LSSAFQISASALFAPGWADLGSALSTLPILCHQHRCSRVSGNNPSTKAPVPSPALEKALLALGLLDQAKELDLRSPHQDFFDPIWRQGWRANDLVQLGSNHQQAQDPEPDAAASGGAS